MPDVEKVLRRALVMSAAERQSNPRAHSRYIWFARRFVDLHQDFYRGLLRDLPDVN